MKSISTKGRIVSLFSLLVLIGVFVYAQQGSSYDDGNAGYRRKSVPTTNLSANTKAKARNMEYGSSGYDQPAGQQEYRRRSVPVASATNASPVTQYAEMSDNARSNDGAYKVKSAPRQVNSTSSTKQPGEEYSQRTAPYKEYEGFFEDVKQSRGSEKHTASAADGEYQRKSVPQASAPSTSVSSTEVNYAQSQAPDNSNRIGGVSTQYKRKSVPTATSSSTSSLASAGNDGKDGYATKRAATDYATAFDNAEQADDTYRVKSAPQSVASSASKSTNLASEDGYRRKSVPQSVSKGSSSSANTGTEYAHRSAPTTPTNSAKSEDGYRVKSVPSSSSLASTSAGKTADGYEQKKAPYVEYAGFFDEMKGSGNYERKGAARQGEHLAQFDNATTNDGAYRRKSAPGGAANTSTSVASEDGYRRKSVPQAGSKSTSAAANSGVEYAQKSAPMNTPSSNTPDSYGGYKTKTAGSKTPAKKSSYEDYAQALGAPSSSATSTTADGYRVKSVPSNAKAGSSAPASSTDGYDKKSAPYVEYAGFFDDMRKSGSYERRGAAAQGEHLAQYDNASSNDGAYRRKSVPGSKGTSSNEDVAMADGYRVKSVPQAGSKSASKSSGTEYAQKSVPTGTEGGYRTKSVPQLAQNQGGSGEYRQKSVPGVQSNRNVTYAQNNSNYNGSRQKGMRMYNTGGLIVSQNVSQLDRSVIVMPRRGRSVYGTVIKDDPGRLIVVRGAAGATSTFKYGEIESLVNV